MPWFANLASTFLPDTVLCRAPSAKEDGRANGDVNGRQGYYHPIFGPDDKWCHLFRVFRHTLWQFVNGDWHMLGERIENATLINMENIVTTDYRTAQLSGFMPSPEFDFGVVSRSEPVWAQVEIRFDVQLEGDAGISFGENASDGVIVRTFGWSAQAV
jgi:hypothetical protein